MIGRSAVQKVAPARLTRTDSALKSISGPIALPWGARLSIVTCLKEMAALRDGWIELQKNSNQPQSVFQSFEWCMAWADTYLESDRKHELCVVTGYANDRLVFVWPLMILRAGLIRTVRWLSEPFGQYGDILVAQDENPRAWLSSATKLLNRFKGIDAIRLRHIREDAAIYPFLVQNFRSEKSGDAAPFMDLSKFADEAAYEARYNKEQRRRRKRIRKALEDIGPVEFRLLDAGSLMDLANEEALKNKLAWLEERDLLYRVLGCPKLQPFLKKLSRLAADNVKVVTSVLSAGGKPISWEIGLRFGKTHFGFITAHDVSFTDVSPARLHMDLAQRKALADGMSVFDLMVPMDRHKESWSNGIMPVHDFIKPLSLKGWVYDKLYVELIWPFLRKVYYSGPSWMRSLASAGMKAKTFLSISA